MKSIPHAKPSVKPISYRVEATEPGLTKYGGAGLLAHWFARLHLPELFTALPDLPATRDYPALRILLGMLYGMVFARSRQAHIAEFNQDPVFLQLTGLEALPSQSALSRFLSRLRMPTAHALLALNRALVARVREGFLHREVLTLDFDSHVQSCRGRPQRSSVGYNRRRPGARSYHPLLAFLGETRDFVGGIFREGKAADRHGAARLLLTLQRWLRESGFRGRLQFRGDHGFYAGWFLELLERRHVAYAIVADIDHIEQHLGGLQWRSLDREYAVAEFPHRGAAWKQARRMIAIRRRLDPKEPTRGRQLKLLEAQGYSYQLVVTNLPWSPEKVWRFYNGRCSMENLIKEGRLGLAMDEVCSHTYAANAVHTWLALLAGNLLGWLGEHLRLPRRESVANLREKLLRIPARLIRTAGQWKLKVSRHSPHALLFFRAHLQVRLQPLLR